MRGAELHLRSNFTGLHPVHALVEHVAGGTAAVIAHSIKIQQSAQAGRELARAHQVGRKPDRIQITELP